MALYVLKPGTPIEASQYTTGLEDGFESFTSDTNDTNPIPPELDYYAHFWTTIVDADDWSVSIPYVGMTVKSYIRPDDYIITPTSGDKTVMMKAEFESKYMLDDSGS